MWWILLVAASSHRFIISILRIYWTVKISLALPVFYLNSSVFFLLFNILANSLFSNIGCMLGTRKNGIRNLLSLSAAKMGQLFFGGRQFSCSFLKDGIMKNGVADVKGVWYIFFHCYNNTFPYHFSVNWCFKRAIRIYCTLMISYFDNYLCFGISYSFRCWFYPRICTGSIDISLSP